MQARSEASRAGWETRWERAWDRGNERNLGPKGREYLERTYGTYAGPVEEETEFDDFDFDLEY